MTTQLAQLTALGNLITALNTHAETISSGTVAGNVAQDLRLQVQDHVELLEEAGLPNFVPAPFESLRKLLGGEEVPLAEIAAARTQLEYVSHFLRSMNGEVQSTPAQRLRRISGSIRPVSIVPPSFRDAPLSAMGSSPALQLGMQDVATKHVRAAILFTDFSQFSKQSKGAQSEYIIDRLNRYFEILIPIAQKMGGIVNKLIGDAIVAFWIDASNNSLKAVQAALAMQEATRNIIEELKSEAVTTPAFLEKLAATGKTLAELTNDEVLELAREVDPLIPLMKIGINTGWVSYGRLGAKLPYYSETTVIGDAVNTAARMESACMPGRICISEAVRTDLPEGMFDLKDLGAVEAKNIGLVQAYGVIRENRLIAINGNGKRAAKAIHGRDDEIRLLRETFLDVVERKSPSFTMLMAAAGEGKSTIANHFLGMVKADDFEAGDVDIVYARGEDQPELEPYQVIAEALRIRAGVDLGSNQEDAEKRRQRQGENELKVRALVDSAFAGKDADGEFAARVLGHFLDVPFEGPSEQMEYLLKDHAELNARMIETVVDVLAGLSRRRPLMVVVDDMQWTDMGTRGLLHTVLTRLEGSPLMVLGLRRLPASDPFPVDEPDWESGPFAGSIIDLDALSTGSLEKIVKDVLGGDVAPETMEAILNRSAQNPLFAREIATAVKNGMQLDQVPTTVQDLFQAQMTRLPEEHIELLKRAAIVGRDFADTDLLALGISEPDHLLPALVEAGFISSVEGMEGNYRFQHDLRRESVLKMMNEAEKESLHAAYGQQLAAAGDKDYAIIAAHLRDGGLHDMAAEYFVRAAEAAANVGAFRTSATFYERTFGLASDPLVRIEALFGWEESLFLGARHSEAVPLLGEFENTLGRASRAAKAVLAEAHFHGARILAYNGRLDEAEREVEKGLGLYAPNESSKTKCDLLGVMGLIYYRFRSDYGKAREAYAAQVIAAEKIGDRQLEAEATYNVGRIELFTGNYSESLAAYREAGEVFRAIGDTKMLLRSMNAVATVLMLIGEYEQPRAILAEAIRISREEMNGFLIDMLCSTQAEVCIALGKYDEAVKYAKEGLAINEGKSPMGVVSTQKTILASAYVGAQEYGKSLLSAREALKVARLVKDNSEEAKALSVLARSYVDTGKISKAISASNAAIRIRERIGSVNQFDEELILTHVKVLMAAKKEREAAEWAERAHRIIERRALKISDESHRKSFVSNVKATREIIRLWQVLREESSKYLSPPVKAILDRVEFYPPNELPEEIRFAAIDRVGKVSRSQDEHQTAAGIVLDIPLASVLVSLLTRVVDIAKNPGEVEGVWAKNIRWEPMFSEDGSLYSVIDWEVASKMGLHKIVFPLIGQQAHRRELLKGDIFSRDGAVIIDLKRAMESHLRSVTGATVDVDPDTRPRKFQFGDVRFVLVPTADGKTILTMEMRRGLYTQNAWNFLKGFVASAMRFCPVNGD